MRNYELQTQNWRLFITHNFVKRLSHFCNFPKFDFLRLSISYFSKIVFLPKSPSCNLCNLPKQAQRQLCPQLKVVVPSQMMRVNGIEMRMDFMPMEMESV